MSVLELSGVAKRYGAAPVLHDLDFVVPDATITAVLGSSGSGKTTLLRLLAGLERADAGTIRIGSRVVDDGRRAVPASQRKVGYVPQDGALFPHLRVAANVGFGLTRRESAKLNQQRIAELLELVGLSGLDARFPHQLSGGQQQRVALARALATDPEIVLLDEPFSSLDASLRQSLGQDIARILGETRTTAVLVTHDQDEAMSLADHIAVLRDGQIVAYASPRELYLDPPDMTTAAAIGQLNVMAGRVSRGRGHCALGAVKLRAGEARPPDGPCQLVIRPEQLAVHLEASKGSVAATVEEVTFYGHDAVARVTLRESSDSVLVRVGGELLLRVGQDVWVAVTGAAHAY
ncbi:MAG TPA: ABC transporter ATP-binding protein [Mycobacteriales bacterium]|jgi:iron(III) transport system ATP-binding protein|nr:ABC transporter ATP-binding protein [Mycobacteriales bacterium]